MSKLRIKDLSVAEYYRDYFTVRANCMLKAEVDKGRVISCSPAEYESLVLKAVEQYKKDRPERAKLLYCLDNNLNVKYQGIELKPLELGLICCRVEFLYDAIILDTYGSPMSFNKGATKLIDYVDLEYPTRIITLDEKEQWVINYLKNKQSLAFVDILDADFVLKYIERFNATFVEMSLGSPKCKELSALLSSMYKKGLLHRYPHGTRNGLSQDGKFPKWVYSYELPKNQ